MRVLSCISSLLLLHILATSPNVGHAQASSPRAARAVVKDMVRRGLIVALEQGPPGILRVSVGERFYSETSKEPYFDKLTAAYYHWAQPGSSVLVEVWNEEGKVGEFADGVFTLGPPFNIPRECSLNEGLCRRTLAGQMPPNVPDPGTSDPLMPDTTTTLAAAHHKEDLDNSPIDLDTTLSPALNGIQENSQNERQSSEASVRHKGIYGTLGTGGTDAGTVSGLALTAGLGVRLGPLLLMANAADVTLSRGDTGLYYRDEFSNGQSRCRNGDNGQFADDSKCIAIDTDYAASADLNMIVPGTPVFLGGGGRVGGDKDLWYGSLGATWGKSTRTMWILRGNVGKNYVSGLISIGFHL